MISLVVVLVALLLQCDSGYEAMFDWRHRDGCTLWTTGHFTAERSSDVLCTGFGRALDEAQTRSHCSRVTTFVPMGGMFEVLPGSETVLHDLQVYCPPAGLDVAQGRA